MSDMNKNLRIAVVLVLAATTMGAVAYACVPLYSLFCKATGFGGTTQRAQAAPQKTSERWVTVGFDTNVDSKLPWDFQPDIHELKVKLGETYTVKFHAHNRGTETTTGMATFNVQPDKAGSYFNKMQCFCFDKQVLQPGENAEFAVQFYVDPAMANDHDTDDVQNITLSYTFFRAKDQGDVNVSSPTAQPKKPGSPS